MSRQLRTLVGAALVAAWMVTPMVGDEPSEAARALLGQVGTVYSVASHFAVANPAYPGGEQALLGRSDGGTSSAHMPSLATAPSAVRGEQALLGR
ncbi:MAG: hypothetical protein ACREMX_13905 [Gemmatimonadales bacterium]